MSLLVQRLLQICLLVMLVSGCDNKPLPKPEETAPVDTTKAKESDPKFWEDKQLSAVLTALTHQRSKVKDISNLLVEKDVFDVLALGETIYAYRYENCMVEGWLQSDTDGGKQPRSLIDLKDDFKQFKANAGGSGESPGDETKQVPAANCSGVVIVSLGKETKAEDGNRWRDVDVILVGLFDVMNSTGSVASSRVKKVSGSVKTEYGIGFGTVQRKSSATGNLKKAFFFRVQKNNSPEDYIQLTVADPKLLSEQK